jgi:fatty acid desaturase
MNYGIITWVAGLYLGMVLLPNHIGTRVIGPDESLSAFRQTLVTTRNLGVSWIEDIVFGGLNNHVEHHLFPTISSVRLRHARVITREFCRQHNLPYREMNWFHGMREVYFYLDEVGRLAVSVGGGPKA